MSPSRSDLICREESSTAFSLCGGDESPEYSSDDLESLPSDDSVDEAIAELLEDEIEHLAGADSIASPQSAIDASLRAESIAWIFKVHAYYGFHPLTAYLAVNYFDRFLYAHYLPKLNGWPLQLLSVACVSLAAKMEEPLVPSLLDLQIEGAKFIFEPRNVQKMELLVLRVLGWRLRCISPFSYLSFFAAKIDPSGIYNGFLVSRAKDIILSTIQETSFIEYRPSCIAASSLLSAANGLPNFSSIGAQHAEKWSHGLLHKDCIASCYQIIQEIVVKNKPKNKQPKGFPQLRAMTRANISSSTSAETSSSSSSSSSSQYCKRRKLNNHSWESDDKTSSD